MAKQQFSLRTCSDCGAKRPANQMHSKSIRAGGATFRSRKSITPMTVIGSLLGSKKASGAIEGWLWNTSNRRGSAKTYKQVNICSICILKPDLSNFRINAWFIFKIPYWMFVILIQLSLSVLRIGLMFFRNPKVYKLLWAATCTLFGVTSMGGKKAVELAKEKTVARRVKALSDKEVIKEVFRSKEFPVISNYVMMNRVAMSDGNLSKDEKRFIASSLDIGSEAIALGNRLLINDKISDIFIDLMRSKDGVDNAFIKELMINLFSLAREDGSVDTSELELLVKFADKLGLSKRDFEKLKNQAKIKTIQLGGTFNPTEMDREINEVFDKM